MDARVAAEVSKISLRTFWSCAGQAHSCRPPQCVERRDRSNGILFEASACLNTQLVPISREAPRRDAHEVDRLGDVLDFLLGHRSMPTKDARPAGHTSNIACERGGGPFADASALSVTLGRVGTEKYRFKPLRLSAVSASLANASRSPRRPASSRHNFTRRYVTRQMTRSRPSINAIRPGPRPKTP